MRSDWKRSDDLVALDDQAIEELFQKSFPGARVTRTELATGGLSNTNIRVSLDRVDRPLRLRLFHRGAEAAALESAVALRVSSRVPLPRCHFASSGGPEDRPYAIYDWVEGERLEAVNPDASGLSQLGRDIGRVLAEIHSVRFERVGFLNGRLEVCGGFDASGVGLVGFAQSVLNSDRGRGRLGDAIAREFLAWLDSSARVLDRMEFQGAVLCHGDFGASNLIVSDHSGRWRVEAVLDWEYACAGTPFGDLGNLLRPPFDMAEGFEPAVIEGYRSAGGVLPENWKQLALLSDLFAWIEFLGRESIDEAIAAAARRRIALAMGAVTVPSPT